MDMESPKEAINYNSNSTNMNNKQNINKPAFKKHNRKVSFGSIAKSAISVTSSLTSSNSSQVNITPRINNKLKMNIFLNQPFSIASSFLSGRIEIVNLSKEPVRINSISVVLTGFEEVYVTHPIENEENFKLFYRTKLLLQDEQHPSSCIDLSLGCDHEGYWTMKRGQAILPFKLKLAANLPNSITTNSGRIAYKLEGQVSCKTGILKENLNLERIITIYEKWEQKEVDIYRTNAVKAHGRKRLFMGGNNPLELNCELVSSLVSAGSLAYVKINICNRTNKKVQGVRLSLIQSITTPFENQNKVYDALKSVYDKVIKEEDIKVGPNEKTCYLGVLEIPFNILSLRFTSLLKVDYFLQVAVLCNMSKDLAVDLPIYISHPCSWMDPLPSIELNLPVSASNSYEDINDTIREENNLNSVSESDVKQSFNPVVLNKNLSVDDINNVTNDINRPTSQIQPVKNRMNVEAKPYTMVKQKETKKQVENKKEVVKDSPELAINTTSISNTPTFFRGYNKPNQSESNIDMKKDNIVQTRPHTVVGNESPYQIGKRRINIENQYNRLSNYDKEKTNVSNSPIISNAFFNRDEDEQIIYQSSSKNNKPINNINDNEIENSNKTSPLIPLEVIEDYPKQKEVNNKNTLYSLFEKQYEMEQYQWNSQDSEQSQFTPEEDLIRLDSIKRLSIKKAKSNKVRTRSFRNKVKPINLQSKSNDNEEVGNTQSHVYDAFGNVSKEEIIEDYNIEKNQLNDSGNKQVTNDISNFNNQILDTNNPINSPSDINLLDNFNQVYYTQPSASTTHLHTTTNNSIYSTQLSNSNNNKDTKNEEMIKMEQQLNLLQQQMSLLLNNFNTNNNNNNNNNNINNNKNINNNVKNKKKNPISKYRQLQSKQDEEWI